MESEVRSTLVTMYKEGKIDAATAMHMMANAGKNESDKSVSPVDCASAHPKRKREASPANNDDDDDVDNLVEGATGLDSLILLTQHFYLCSHIVCVTDKGIMYENHSSPIMHGVAEILIISIPIPTLMEPCPVT